MSQSCFYWYKIGHAKSRFSVYSAIWRSEGRISSRYFEITSNSLVYFLTFSRKKELLVWLSCMGFEPTHLCDLSDQKRLQVEGLADCATATQCSLGNQKLLLNYALVSSQDWVRKFVTFRLVPAISRNETGITSRYLGITPNLVFNLLEELIEDITWPRRDTKFLFECWKTFHEWALLSNCFMMNLKLQNAAQIRFVFVECYVVKLLSCVAWLSRTLSTFSDYSWKIN